MKTISLGGYLVSVSLIFHKELSWPLVVTTLTLAPPSSVNIRAGPNFYVKPSNSPRMHEEFLFSKQKRFNYTQYMNITQQSQSQEIVKVVRQETEVKICNVCIPISYSLRRINDRTN